MTSIMERAAKLDLRFDVRGLREFLLIDEHTGETHDFETADAVRDFLTARELEEQRHDVVRDHSPGPVRRPGA